MKICLLSDLHLDFHFDGGVEFVRFLTIPEDCDLTIVAGDLCQADHWRWHQSIQEICQKSKQVLYVLGNHEYYNSSILEVDVRAHKLPNAFPNLIVASRAVILSKKEIPALNDLKLLAGTLWFPNAPDQHLYKQYLNDFGFIEQLEPEIYQRNYRFTELLDKVKSEPSIVVTHHLPSYQSVNPKYSDSPINRFFVGGEFQEEVKDSQVKVWCHGHSHDAVNYKIGNTRIVSDPAGCPNEIPVFWEPLIVDI